MALGRLLVPSFNAFKTLARARSTCASHSIFSPVSSQKNLVMANVTKSNFWQAYDQLVGHLQRADFVSFDFEMTGVQSAFWRRTSELDTCETRYLHVKNSAESFAVWQCGLCTFKWDDQGQKFVAHPFNFFIFPRNELPVKMPLRNYYSETSSLEFLAKHRFDFNTTVYSGISYLSREHEEIARQNIGLTEETQKLKRLLWDMEPEIALTRVGDVLFSEKVKLQVGEWRDRVLRCKRRSSWAEIESGFSEIGTQFEKPRTFGKGSVDNEHQCSASIETKARLNYTEEKSQRPYFTVDVSGHHQARLTKQVLRKHFPDVHPAIEKNCKQMKVYFTSSKADRQRLEYELELENRKELEGMVLEAVGFRKVIDAVEAVKIPIVGHNCLLDLAHLHDKFFGPLPANLKSFSSSVLNHFPCIVDTKYLLKTHPGLRDANNGSTSLAIVYQRLCQGFADHAASRIPDRFYSGKPKEMTKPLSRVKIEISPEMRRYSGATDTGSQHEAGFDALMTGSVFAQICHLLGLNPQALRSVAQNAGSQAAVDHAGFTSLVNLLMIQSFQGAMALDLRTGKEAEGDRAPRGPQSPSYRLRNRENVVLVWGPPSKIQDDVLRKMVQNVFWREKRLANVNIVSVDDSAAFVEFRSTASCESFLLAFQAALADVLQSDSFLDLKDFKVARFTAYERICGSPLFTESLGRSADLLDCDQSKQSGAVDLTRKKTSILQKDLDSWREREPAATSEQTSSREVETDGYPIGGGERTLEDGSLLGTGTEAFHVATRDIIETPSSTDPDHPHGLTQGEANHGLASSLSYRNWMKRVFEEDESLASSKSKKPRICEGSREDGTLSPGGLCGVCK